MGRFIRYTITQGDSLQSIAQEFLNGAERWTEIALLNDLDHPFIHNDEHPYDPYSNGSNVKKIGDSILIPVEHIDNLIPQFDLESVYDRALGTDLEFAFDDASSLTNAKGELVATTYGDLSTVSGIKNLKQAIVIRFSTPLGTLLYHPTYGSSISDTIGKKASSDALHLIRVEVERTIRSDYRIGDVVIEVCKLVGDTVVVEVSVTPLGFDEVFNMNLVFGKGGIIGWD